MERLINKTNNIEKNAGRVERSYYLGGKIWIVGRERLFIEGRAANGKEIKEFLKLKEEFEK